MTEHASFDGREQLAPVTGDEKVFTYGYLKLVKTGKGDLIEQVNIDDETLQRFSDIVLSKNMLHRPARHQGADQKQRDHFITRCAS